MIDRTEGERHHGLLAPSPPPTAASSTVGVSDDSVSPSLQAPLLGVNCVLPVPFLPEILEGLLDRIAGAGFHALEFSRLRGLTLESAERLREMALGRGLAPWSIHSGPLRGPEPLAAGRRLLDLAAALGARVHVLHVSSRRFAAADPEVRRRVRARDQEIVRDMAHAAGERGLIVGLENGAAAGQVDYLEEILAAVDQASLGIALDVGHAHLRGGDPAAAARRLAPHIRHVHLHDNHGARDEHLPPGGGTIDWRALLAALHEIGYVGPWMVELRMSRDPAALAQAAAFLRHWSVANPSSALVDTA
jgi:sugar phosphate isomerase/epimerase